MAKQTNRLMLLKIGDGQATEAFNTLGALNSKTFTINNNNFDVTTADSTTPGGQLWQELMTGIRSVSVSGSGLFDDSTQDERLREVAFGTGASDTGDAVANFQLIVPDFGTFEGAFHVDTLEYGADGLEGAVAETLSLSSSGVITWTAAA